jgi:hypothetical protein
MRQIGRSGLPLSPAADRASTTASRRTWDASSAKSSAVCRRESEHGRSSCPMAERLAARLSDGAPAAESMAGSLPAPPRRGRVTMRPIKAALILDPRPIRALLSLKALDLSAFYRIGAFINRTWCRSVLS